MHGRANGSKISSGPRSCGLPLMLWKYFVLSARNGSARTLDTPCYYSPAVLQTSQSLRREMGSANTAQLQNKRPARLNSQHDSYFQLTYPACYLSKPQRHSFVTRKSFSPELLH